MVRILSDAQRCKVVKQNQQSTSICFVPACPGQSANGKMPVSGSASVSVSLDPFDPDTDTDPDADGSGLAGLGMASINSSVTMH